MGVRKDLDQARQNLPEFVNGAGYLIELVDNLALATPDQIAGAEARVRELQAAGTLESWFRERDARRRGIGQFTFYLAARS